jgi:hypothetical protein
LLCRPLYYTHRPTDPPASPLLFSQQLLLEKPLSRLGLPTLSPTKPTAVKSRGAAQPGVPADSGVGAGAVLKDGAVAAEAAGGGDPGAAAREALEAPVLTKHLQAKLMPVSNPFLEFLHRNICFY